MPRRRLAELRILLTGASSGIGRELARTLAARGARLLLTARRADLLQAVADECAHEGGAVEFLSGDVTDAAHRAALTARTAELWGGLDVLINNAGVSAHGRFADSDEATLRQVMEVNFFAAAELTRLTLPLLQSGRTPAIVNVGSIIGHRGLPFNSEYSASKFALRGFSEALRAELAADDIDVIQVSPGTTDTEFFDHLVAKRVVVPWQKREHAISAAEVAGQTVRALERGRREIFPNWRGHALILVNRLFPQLVDRGVARLASRSQNHSDERRIP
jgi:short-subunit dehydrogenase